MGRKCERRLTTDFRKKGKFGGVQIKKKIKASYPKKINGKVNILFTKKEGKS